ncbi:unnamed protein product [Malus baccata var. baccata]
MEVPMNEPPAVFLDRTSRATRGKRMTKLLDEEIEEDEMFWNQEALKEDEDDGNYEAEPEVADEFDSDFDEDEPDPDEGAENNDADERVRTKKRLIYPGKQSSKKKKKRVLSELKSKDGSEKSSNPEQHQDAPEEAEVERTVRKSTRTSVVVRQAERDAIRAALQATMKPIKRKKEGEEKRMTQEEMLLEAAQTEIMNLRNLERVLAREEEVKKRAIVHKAVYTGPQVRYFSKDGKLSALHYFDQICLFGNKNYCPRMQILLLWQYQFPRKKSKLHFLQAAHIWNSVEDCHFSQKSLPHLFPVRGSFMNVTFRVS